MDLDENAFSYHKKNKRMDQEVDVGCFHILNVKKMNYHKSSGIFFVDKIAFLEVKKFLDNGHDLQVVTAGAYPPEMISKVFNELGIDIKLQHGENYFNRFDFGVGGSGALNKQEFIDKHLNNNKAMLIDDQFCNQPKAKEGVLFTLTLPSRPFPTLVAIDKQLVLNLQKVGIDYDEIWKHAKDNLELQALAATTVSSVEGWQKAKQFIVVKSALESFNPAQSYQTPFSLITVNKRENLRDLRGLCSAVAASEEHSGLLVGELARLLNLPSNNALKLEICPEGNAVSMNDIVKTL
ncbi:hypothetical protein PsalMR5_01685 [Piscirickettsia salmonis]|uniref:hypothetical protein n=1 Tax=Piscirickettsia salmonis TaxID=1238 RepID=UPI0012BAC460|nr:hypothetical protein [Piscirickettsia salmonis]QGP54244.1 hypothetical protein PsalSR1_01676 [Piscirickettsia salmonis]QGP59857.1 hypothetical protein PsalBI1_02454 [Piscirickettsia salmonis]QGP63821.1 hypothetical protein PsalMR5_01685 [Piscirickettsia salmonis]